MQKSLYKVKYQYLINKREKVGLKHYYDPKAFIGYSTQIMCKMFIKILKTQSRKETQSINNF